VNWDLKRDLNKKLVPLEKMTKEAIYTLVRMYEFPLRESSLLMECSGTRLGAQTSDASKDIASAMDARAAAEDSDDDEDQ
jgi:hypothetical protein